MSESTQVESKENKKSKGLTTLFKWSLGLILGTFIMKFLFGLDANVLVKVLEQSDKITLSDEFHAMILLIKTLISMPLAVGLGVFLVELLDIFTTRKKK